jgi:hypothetical protein
MAGEDTFDIDDAISDVLSGLTGGDQEVMTDDETAEVDIEDDAHEVDNVEDDETEVAEEESEVGDEDGESEEPAEEDTEDIVELTADMTVVIDGKTVKVEDALEMRADYTRKTQALAEEREAFETEREAISTNAQHFEELQQAWHNDPGDVLAGMAASAEEPIEVLTQAVRDLSAAGEIDANLLLVKTAVALIGDGFVDDELRMQLGFDDEAVEKLQQQSKQEQRISRLERQSRQAPEKSEEPDDRELAKARAAIEQNWQGLVESESELSGLDEQALANVKAEVARFALDKGGIPMDVAYAAMQASRLKAEAAAAKKKAAAASSKRKARVVSKPTNTAATPTPRDPSDLDSAILDALSDLQGK